MNQLGGSIPSGFGLRSPDLLLLDLSSNRLVGPLPHSLGNLSRLQRLRVFSNMLSGTIPLTLCWLTRLTELSLNTNRFEGSIPDIFSSLPRLRFLDLHANTLSGCIPVSLRSLSKLEIFDLSLNSLTGDFDLFTSEFFPSVMNVSFNRLGPRLAPYPYAPNAAARYSLMDIRSDLDSSSAFSCPFPDEFPLTTVVLRSACRQPWNLLAQYLGIFVAASFASAFVAWLLIQLTSASVSQIRFTLWILVSVSTIASLVFDITTLVAILQRLYRSVDNCVVLNRAAVFEPYLSTRSLAEEVTPATLFTAYLFRFRVLFNLVAFTDENPAVQQMRAEFSALCRRLPECGVDALGTTCTQLFPELSDSNGEAHRIFRIMVLIVTAVFVFVELARLACVVMSLHDGRLFGGFIGVELSFSSFAAPVLLASKTLRGTVTHYILHPQTTANDIICRLIHTVVLTKAPLLAINLYFLLSVTQVGMGWQNWLGLMSNSLKIAHLIAQAVAECRKAPARMADSASDSKVDMRTFKLDGLGVDALSVNGAAISVAGASGGTVAGSAVSAALEMTDQIRMLA
jgi:hypothetical protein